MHVYCLLVSTLCVVVVFDMFKATVSLYLSPPLAGCYTVYKNILISEMKLTMTLQNSIDIIEILSTFCVTLKTTQIVLYVHNI